MRETLHEEALFADRFEDGFVRELGGAHLLPLLGPADRAQIAEEQFELNVKLSVQVFLLHIQFSSEESQVVQFDLLLTVADEEGAGFEAGEVLLDVGLNDVVMVQGALLGLPLLLLVQLRGEDAVGIRIV